MEKKIQLFIINSLLMFAVVISAQVGINTQDVRGVFHLDAGKDNPASGTISASQVANDVMVDANGNMGVGTIAPVARLHLKADAPFKAFRLEDGSEGENRILQGDKDGRAFWGMTKGLGGYILDVEDKYLSFYYNTPIKLPINESGNEILILNDGTYSIMLRWVPMLMKRAMPPSDNTTMRSRQVQVQYELIRKRDGAADYICESTILRPFMAIYDHSLLYISLMAEDILKDDKLYIRVTFLSNSDSDASNLYLYLDPNNPYSTRSREAYDSGAIIFYQL